MSNQTTRAAPAQPLPLWAHFAIALAFTLVGIAVTWPLAEHMNAIRLVGGDGPNKYWRFWQTAEALRAGQNPAYIDMLGYPVARVWPIYGVSLAIPVLFSPFTRLASPAFAYNLSLILSFGLTGYTAFLLVRDVVGGTRGALLGGLIVMLFPARAVHAYVGHVEFASLYIPLLALVVLRRGVQHGAWPVALVGGMLTGLAALVHTTVTAYFLLPLLAALMGLTLWQARQDGRLRRALLVGLGAAGAALIVSMPAYVPLLRYIAANPGIVAEPGDSRFFADALNFLTPYPLNPLLGELAARFGDPTVLFENYEKTAAVGLSVAALAAAGLALRPRREAWFWLAVTLAAVVLALGPTLTVGGEQVLFRGKPVRLPYRTLDKAPLLSFGRTPGRFTGVVSVGLAMLAAHGLASVGRLTGRGWRLSALSAAAALLVAAEYVVPYNALHSGELVRVPDAVHALAEQPETGGVLSVPVGRVRSEAMFYQTVHHRPLVAGRVDRDINPMAGLLELARQATTPHDAGLPDADAASVNAMLAHYGVETVLLHRSSLKDAELAANEARLEALFGEPTAQDERVAVYAVDASAQGDGLILALTDKFGRLVFNESGDDPILSGEGTLYVYSTGCAQATVTLAFEAVEGEITLSLPDGTTQRAAAGEPATVTFELALAEGITAAGVTASPAAGNELDQALVGTLSAACVASP